MITLIKVEVWATSRTYKEIFIILDKVLFEIQDKAIS